MDEVANPNPNPNPEPNPNPNPNPNPKPRPAAARPPARACRPVRLGAQAGCYYGPEGGRRSCKRERHDLQVPINTPSGAGLPHGPEPSAFAACMRQRGWALACALVPPPKSPTPPPLT